MLEAGSALRILALVGAGAAATGIAAAPAAAQDYTSGAVAGTVTDEAGAAVAGASVTLTSDEQGFTRTATTGSSGTFRFAGLPAGSYTLTVETAGKDTFTANDVRVLPSQSADLAIGLTTTGNEIVVTGAIIATDFTGTTTGVNVDVSELTKTVPVSRDLTSVVLLAPGTTGGDTAFQSNGQILPSVGGASIAENAYYVNGLNTTNFDTYVGSANVPFDFYRTIEVKSAGYSAEFGRATGGIINATTKSGSNDFYAAAHLNWSPRFLRSGGTNLLNCSFVEDPTQANPTPETVCENLTNREFDYVENRSLSLEAGGPIIEDRLFVYGLVEFRKNESLTVNRASGTGIHRLSDDPFWGFKVDAYPIDGHHFEFTMFDTETTTVRSDLAYVETDGVPSLGLAKSVTDFNTGGTSYVAKYTGNLTDFLTVSGAYGRMRDRFDNVGVAGSVALPAIQVPATAAGPVLGVDLGGFFTDQTIATTSFPYRTEREFFRGDADLYFTLFGEHHIRAGFDIEDNTLSEASVRNGGNLLFQEGFITPEAYNAGFGGAGIFFQALPSGSANHVIVNYFNNGGSFGAKNKAFYLQDEWNVTDRLTLNLGVRRDDFAVNRADGENMVTMKENYAPRLGASYELFEDHSGRVYGAYGQYFLPFASNTAFRMTGEEYFIRERFEFLGVDANGLPILGNQITNNASYQAACPFALTTFSSGQNCNVTSDGIVGSSDTLIDHNLKATKQTEWLIGYEQTFSGVPLLDELKVGINYTNRRLNLSAEDVAIDLAVLQYCEEQGIAGCSDTWTGFHQYVVVNPGNDVTVNLDGLDGQEVTFTAEQLGYPPASRKYDAVELTFERPFDGKWNIGGSYTWSKSRGNSEGFVQSDFGQDDAGITQDFDQPGFIDGAFGYLPNDRRHRIKLWGAYSIIDGLSVGTNVRIDSPRSLSCIGHNPNANPFTPEVPYSDFGNAYGAAAHYCNGELSPRGTALKSDWIYNVDLKVAYEMKIASGQTVRLRADVFNLFNSQGIQKRDEIGESEGFAADADDNILFYYANANYSQATVYQTPRSVRVGLDIEF